MNRKILKTKGEKVAECDFNNNGIYAGTEELYIYEGCLYRVLTYNNDLNYNGRNTTMLLSDNPERELHYLANNCEMCYESYHQLCERFGEDPEL